MKAQADSQHQGDQQVPDVRPAVRSSLSEEQQAILECLRKAPGGLTGRQLEARVACGRDATDHALSVLLERRLIARLNTIIPSYAARVTASGVED